MIQKRNNSVWLGIAISFDYHTQHSKDEYGIGAIFAMKSKYSATPP